MDYLLRKFKLRPKRPPKEQSPQQTLVSGGRPMTSDASEGSDSTPVEMELADRLSDQFNHVLKLGPKRVKCKASDKHNNIASNRQSLHHSLHSSESSQSRSSGSVDGPQQQTTSDLSAVAKVCPIIIFGFCHQKTDNCLIRVVTKEKTLNALQ